MGDIAKPALLHDKQLLITDTMPDDWDFLDAYQEWAAGMVIHDEDRATIRGKQPLEYLLAGLDEEAHEATFDTDKTEPDYNRWGSLALFGFDNGPLHSPGTVTETAIARHVKEFGDIAWYLVNILDLCGLQYSETIEPGLISLELERATNIAIGRGTDEFHDHIERHAAGIFLFPGVLGELRVAAHGLARPVLGQIPADTYLKRRGDRGQDEKRLVIAAGQYTIVANHLLVNRFDSSYQAALEGNIAKLTKRVQDKTVFDKSGGDDR